jgi:zinc protease
MRKASILCALLLISLQAFSQATFQLPAYEKFTLANGLTIYLMEQREVPLISVSAMLPAGAIRDTKATAGLSSITADALMFGTKNFTKSQLEEGLDFMGASLNTYGGKEAASLSATFASKDSDQVLALIKEVLVQPSFPEAEWEKAQARLLVELDQQKESPRAVINDYYNNFVFAEHVYGNTSSGTKSSVQNIKVEDIRSFYEEHYHPAASAIAVVGDFKRAEMKKKLQKLFRDWKGKGQPKSVEPGKVPEHAKARILLVNKPDARETTFLIGGPGVPRNHPDFVPIQVVNTILGGRFTSWLNDELRVNSGLTYGARSAFDSYREGGSFVISTFTKTESTEEAIDLALQVNNRLHEQGVDEETLESAKNYVKGQYPPKYETARSLASLLTSMYFYGFDEEFINTFQQKVDSLDVARANEVVKKHFPAERLQFVLIGKADEVREVVQKYGELTEKNIADESF